jgi:hypothetical protein
MKASSSIMEEGEYHIISATLGLRLRWHKVSRGSLKTRNMYTIGMKVCLGLLPSAKPYADFSCTLLEICKH